MYDVIWIDKDWEDLTSFKDLCRTRGIKLIPFKDVFQAQRYIQNNASEINAVITEIVDGNYRKTCEAVSSFRINVTGVFIYYNDVGTELEYYKSICSDRVYHKGTEDEELLVSLGEFISDPNRNWVEKHYESVFYVMDKWEITPDVIRKNLLQLHFPKRDFCEKDMFTPLRKVLEQLFRVLNSYGLIPDGCINSNGEVAVAWCYHYLVGHKIKNLKVRYGGEDDRIVPRQIGKYLDSIITFLDIKSHDEKSCYVEGIQDDKYLYGLTLNLCDFICWMYDYVGKHPDKKENMSKCRNVE